MSENINMVDALHKTIYNQDQQIAELEKQLEEKDADIIALDTDNYSFKQQIDNLRQQLKSQPAEIVEKIKKEFQNHLIEWYEDEENINNELYLDADCVWEILNTILKEYQK